MDIFDRIFEHNEKLEEADQLWHELQEIEQLMKDNRFTTLTDDLYELFLACIKSGFTDEQAFELTKTIILWQILISH